tara:strand:- start:696 stop:923 length:228 start_codon:yes stop_codon:yes gene_type:complete
MTTLALTRKFKGTYGVENESIFISLSNCFRANGCGTNSWELIIEDKISGKELLHEWFDTKKEASLFGADFIMDNL